MTKQELFKKYNIDESHNKLESIDNWMGVELYRVMHNGQLPPQDDKSVDWITKFLDMFSHNPEFRTKVMTRKEKDWGSLFLTAKRMVYSLADQIIAEAS